MYDSTVNEEYESYPAISGQWDCELSISAVATANPGPAANLHSAATNAPGKPPLPRFNLSAYNGGPMKLAGWKFPVVFDLAGVQFACDAVPIYVGHPAADAPGTEIMDTLVGRASCTVMKGRLESEGTVTGTGKTVSLMLAHARNGFKFQISPHAQISNSEFLPEGESKIVNGRAVIGPVVVARASLIDHIAILPLGADTSTSANITATQAAGKGDKGPT